MPMIQRGSVGSSGSHNGTVRYVRKACAVKGIYGFFYQRVRSEWRGKFKVLVITSVFIGI